MTVDYLKFAEQMRPLSDSILNTLKIKEAEIREKVTSVDP